MEKIEKKGRNEMKAVFKRLLGCGCALALSSTLSAMTPVLAYEEAENMESFESHEAESMDDITRETASVTMYRMYNPNSGEHFYTANSHEKDNLFSVGWEYEGIGWIAPGSSNTPVYRLYNPNAGDHHYTTSKGERDSLVAAGWRSEGTGWYSDDSKTVPLYRQYNPNAKSGTHNYTTNKGENDSLCSIGWRGEGIGWYALEGGKPVSLTSVYKDVYRPVVEGVRNGSIVCNDPIPVSDIYYALQDMNGDRVLDFAITDKYGIINKLYTSVGHKARFVADGWSRSAIFYVGGQFMFHGSGGMMKSYSGLFTMGSDGSRNWSVYIFSNPNSSLTDYTCYLNTSGSDSPSASTRISKEEFSRRSKTIASYQSKLTLYPLRDF